MSCNNKIIILKDNAHNNIYMHFYASDGTTPINLTALANEPGGNSIPKILVELYYRTKRLFIKNGVFVDAALGTIRFDIEHNDIKNIQVDNHLRLVILLGGLDYVSIPVLFTTRAYTPQKPSKNIDHNYHYRLITNSESFADSPLVQDMTRAEVLQLIQQTQIDVAPLTDGIRRDGNHLLIDVDTLPPA